MTCPQCGADCERDMVDVGIGEIPSGPWGCPECHWVDRSTKDADALLDPTPTEDR